MQSETNYKTSQGSLTTCPERFSEDSWNLLLSGEDLAKRWKHENLDVEHLIQVLFNDATYQSFTRTLSIDHEVLLDQLEDFLAEQPTARGEILFIGDGLEDLLENAERFRMHWGSRLIEISHILFALGRDKRIGSELFEEAGLPSEKLEAEIRKLPIAKRENEPKEPRKNAYEKPIQSQTVSNSDKQISKAIRKPPRNIQANTSDQEAIPLALVQEESPLDAYGRDLTAAAQEGLLDPVIGRDAEIKNLIKVLSRRGKNNPVLIGAPGVGKTAIAELLAQRIVEEKVPESLKGLRLISLDIGALIAGAKFRGQFEERLRSVLTEVSNPDAGVMLFIDELHSIINTDRPNADATSLLKPLLEKGALRCIGATTPENYRKKVEKDQALNRLFQQVLIKEPNIDLSVEILRGLKVKYESHHEVKISDEAIKAANLLANRYISDRCLPDKAIDLIDEAAAQLKMESTSKPHEIEEAESKFTELDIALSKADKIDKEKRDELEYEREVAEKNLLELSDAWEEERSQRENLKNLKRTQKSLENEIIEKQDIGNLEEASRLEYEDLYSTKECINEIEYFLSNLQEEGKSFIKDEVKAEDIADLIARWTGIPVQRVLAGERQKLLNLEIGLAEKVIGQAEAVNAVSAAIRRARAGMKDPKRPVGSFLFLGPTGVGKTELAKALASSLFDEEEALVRLDMSEFMERNAVARMIGAPPGYVGYEEGGQLTEAVRRRPYAVLLLDEIEKAHPDVFNVLLQVLDDGRLTDSQGRTVDFRHTVIVMTSNLASREILDTSKELNQAKESDIQSLVNNLSKEIEYALGKKFRPEFLNRIDEIIRFRPLDPDDLKQIVRLQITELGHLLEEQGLDLRVDNATVETLALEGYQPEYGARPLKRVLRRKLENPLATQLLEEAFNDARAVIVRLNSSSSELLEFIPEN